jgi:hypothetical protein
MLGIIFGLVAVGFTIAWVCDVNAEARMIQAEMDRFNSRMQMDMERIKKYL